MSGNAYGFKELVSLVVEVTVGCKAHGSHTATMQGPWEKVLTAIDLLRQVCDAQDRWMITEYRPSEEELPMLVSEWTP